MDDLTPFDELEPKARRDITVEGQRLLLIIFYEGPWCHATSWLLGNGRFFRKDVQDGSLRERLSRWTEHRDQVWRERYIQTGKKPARVWKRR